MLRSHDQQNFSRFISEACFRHFFGRKYELVNSEFWGLKKKFRIAI